MVTYVAGLHDDIDLLFTFYAWGTSLDFAELVKKPDNPERRDGRTGSWHLNVFIISEMI